MKVSVKKDLIIFHCVDEWSKFFQQILEEHGSRIAISYVCRRELGFTVRRHKGLEPHDDATWEAMKSEGWHHRYYYQDQVHLDFYDPAQHTWFVLKYLKN